MEEAILMARYATQNGIHTLVATPHHADGKHENEAVFVDDAVKALNVELDKRDINITILPGQEVRIYKGLLDDLSDGKIRTLNGTQYILLELPANRIPDYFDDLLHELYIMQLTPIIAHPERHTEFIKHPNVLQEYVEEGLLCQITSHSLLGQFGRNVQKFALKLCKENLAHMIASDGHNTDGRPVNLAQAIVYIRSMLGEERARYYVHNAAKLIRGESIEYESGCQKKRKMFWAVT